MHEIREMTGGTLAGEIQRKTAEIDNWPDWAKPYEQQTPTVPSAADCAPTHADPHESLGGAQPPGERTE